MGSPVMIYKTKASSFINFIAREIFMTSIKKNKSKRLNFDFNFKNEIISLNTRIHYDKVVNGVYKDGFDIYGSSSEEDIEMYISIHSLDFKKDSYNEFNSSIREFLRHELEHIAQYLNVNGKPSIYDSYPTSLVDDYLTQPFEIDAFLYGLNYKRKYLKTNILDEIDNLLNSYYKIEDNITFEKIKTIWIERLKIILPHTLKQ